MAGLLSWLVGTVSPERAVKRERAALTAARFSRARMLYEGATTGRRASGWRVVGTDANSEIKVGGGRLRDNARDMRRNVPDAARAIRVIAQNVVGPGIIPTIKGGTAANRKRAEELLRAHLDTVKIDVRGRKTLYGIQEQAMGTVAGDGEILVRFRPRRAEDGLPLPFQLQTMEADYLDTSKDGTMPNGNVAVQGVEYFLGAPVAYWLFDAHPGSTTANATVASKRIPAEFVAHVFLEERAEQGRGVSWLAPCILRMRDLADYWDAQILRQKIAACFAGFISEAESTGEGVTDPDEAAGETYGAERIEPALLTHLSEGESITFGNPPQVGDFGPVTITIKREIAAGVGIPYEALTGDYSQTNFSSGRLGWLEFQRSITSWRSNMLEPQLLHRIGDWFLQAATLVGVNTKGMRVEWTAPKREMIDPSVEIPAARDAIRSGLTSRAAEIRKYGREPDEVDAEIEDDNKRADAAGLVFDSDPRQRTQQGNPTQTAATGGAPPDQSKGIAK